MVKETKVFYTAHARRELLDLDKTVARRIVMKIKNYSEASDPIKSSKSLSGALAGLYRYRIGDYRAIFEYDTKGIVNILAVLCIKVLSIGRTSTDL